MSTTSKCSKGPSKPANTGSPPWSSTKESTITIQSTLTLSRNMATPLINARERSWSWSTSEESNGSSSKVLTSPEWTWMRYWTKNTGEEESGPLCWACIEKSWSRTSKSKFRTNDNHTNQKFIIFLQKNSNQLWINFEFPYSLRWTLPQKSLHLNCAQATLDTASTGSETSIKRYLESEWRKH